MNLIIPMAGLGKRMRPHTLSVPKPLLKIAGKSIIERLIELIISECKNSINEIHYVIGNFGNEVESELKLLAKKFDAEGIIHYQDKALGTAHAVYCAKSALKDEIIISFADTLFTGKIEIGDKDENIIWTMEVKNPELYGVIVEDMNNYAIKIVEKPKNKISSKAIIGVYYFRESRFLLNELERLIEQDIRNNNEYQLTDALISMMNDKMSIRCKVIDDWMDCGNKNEFLETNKKILKLKAYSRGNIKRSNNITIDNDVFYGNNIELTDSNIEKYVSIGNNCIIKNCRIENSILGDNIIITNSDLKDSIIGNNSIIHGAKGVLNIGDYSSYENK